MLVILVHPSFFKKYAGKKKGLKLSRKIEKSCQFCRERDKVLQIVGGNCKKRNKEQPFVMYILILLSRQWP
jgi:hypothetical protein